jgi:hypothetical protein
MRTLLKTFAIAALALSGSAASAQDFGMRIGIGDSGHRRVERRIDRDFDDVRIERRRFVRDIDYRRPIVRRRIVERRIFAPPRRVRTVCRTVIRERVTPVGVVIRRPTRICTTRPVGRRLY